MSELTYPAKVATTTSQPKAGIEMNITGPGPQAQQRQHCENESHKVSRLRGGGAGKDVAFVLRFARVVAIASLISSAVLARCVASCSNSKHHCPIV
ncbi:hypothetical protein PQX77_006087 [Marasmius sp. AFHP31]|nr:hypothetical protein PQX77_006087 [Marasmius sp. AFHP31]